MEILEGQANYAKDFQYKKDWMPGTVMEKSGPVSAWVQLNNGTVIWQHQDHVQSRENDVAGEPVASMTTSVTTSMTPAVLPESGATPPTPGVRNQLEVPKSPPAAPTLTLVKTSHALCGIGPDLDTWKTTCVNSDFIKETVVEKEDK